MVCGKRFHTGAPVVLWTDAGGYDAYRFEPRFPQPPVEPAAALPATQSPAAIVEDHIFLPRFGIRSAPSDPVLARRVLRDGWTLPLLRASLDQFVIHYDAAGTSRACFRILHDVRGLSVHFMLDLDGTIYQTLDLRERAWHATIANDRSIGIEIANIGAYELSKPDPLSRWYRADADGTTHITFPIDQGSGGLRVQGFDPRPARSAPVTGAINGLTMSMYDFTPEQYRSLIALTATLCRIFPNIACDFPRTAIGDPEVRALSPERFAAHHGLIGHFHIQPEKTDPGPAFQWETVVAGARAALRRAESRDQRTMTGRLE